MTADNGPSLDPYEAVDNHSQRGTEMNVNDAMRTIQSLDPDASLDFSVWTGKWFVSADIHVKDDCVLTGIIEHRDAPEDAVFAYLDRLQDVDQHNHQFVLVARSHDAKRRRHWRWNGAAFAEDPYTPSELLHRAVMHEGAS